MSRREAGAVGEIAVVQEQPRVRLVRVRVQVVDARGVEGAGAADDAVDFVAPVQEQLRKVGAVLAGDAGDKSSAFLRLNHRAGYLLFLPLEARGRPGFDLGI